MIYNSRNLTTIKELAPNTELAANKLYEFCVKNKIEILIYDGIRTEAEQRANIARGVSKTMKSYHLVGQALDFVPVNEKGVPQWNLAAYKTGNINKMIAFAKTLGFEWGGDWKNFVDAPHLQFNFKGYGTDKVEEVKPVVEGYVKPKTVHTVVKGDTLSGISLLTGVGISQIKVLNGLKTDVIIIGQVLKLVAGAVKPAPKPAATKPVVKAVIAYPGVVKKGSKGKDVEAVQRALKIAVDGSFGPGTEKAVKAYQVKKGLKPDGMVGPSTWYMIF